MYGTVHRGQPGGGEEMEDSEGEVGADYLDWGGEELEDSEGEVGADYLD